MLFTMPWRSPFKYRMLPGVPWGVGGLGDEKYRQQVPTAVPGFDGATCCQKKDAHSRWKSIECRALGEQGDEKYRQRVPTAVPGFDGATCQQEGGCTASAEECGVQSIGRAGKRQGVCVCVYARVCVHVHLRAYSKHLPAAVQQQLTNSNSRAAME
eukprot:1146645-Pelagomonas_calceolata.AAC.3